MLTDPTSLCLCPISCDLMLLVHLAIRWVKSIWLCYICAEGFTAQVIKTPNIEAFAKEAVKFTNAFAQASTCSVSMLDVHRWGLITSFCSQAYMGLSMLMRNLQGNTRTSAAIARSRIFSNLGKCLSSFVLIPEVQSLIVMAQGAQCLPIHERGRLPHRISCNKR